jgi:TP901 family phage tail tape measure protein
MARFAKQANISAKELNTTTREYAKAALIYYQQGLKESEVKERTDVTVKMANVTGDGAQEVSSYMTAIWNNFNKAGDESVEHYADVMTKLGAATAASTSEIAAGLSKFSAVADTIGLSFDMATSAVTAIVDQTRETPEVVGTALKTIFSRIEGLQQGETMEDGVNLNKYSKGLQKVGVDIMNANGELKNADQILNEIGAKWETLDKNQQVALAQTTAGVRQYNQFMALFDNWDKVQ